MATWFGHTQTVATIGKSVTTVAGGIIGLQSNLANFMRRVVYFEKFFQRHTKHLPEEIHFVVQRLFKKCYEYRDEIREELQYVIAQRNYPQKKQLYAGRWVVGLEDWNTKMEKRIMQISEMVLLANSLLAEYAITGAVNSHGFHEELHAYLSIISETIILNGEAPDTSQPEVCPEKDPSGDVQRTTKQESLDCDLGQSNIQSDEFDDDARKLESESLIGEEDSFNPFNMVSDNIIVETRSFPEIKTSGSCVDSKNLVPLNRFSTLEEDEIEEHLDQSPSIEEELVDEDIQVEESEDDSRDLSISYDFELEYEHNPFGVRDLETESPHASHSYIPSSNLKPGDSRSECSRSNLDGKDGDLKSLCSEDSSDNEEKREGGSEESFAESTAQQQVTRILSELIETAVYSGHESMNSSVLAEENLSVGFNDCSDGEYASGLEDASDQQGEELRTIFFE